MLRVIGPSIIDIQWKVSF